MFSGGPPGSGGSIERGRVEHVTQTDDFPLERGAVLVAAANGLGDRLGHPDRALAQGTALGRSGRVRIDPEGERIWVGGATRTFVDGSIDL